MGADRRTFGLIATLHMLTFGLWGCTAADPTLELIGTLSSPNFNGKTNLVLTVASPTGTTSFTGSCDTRTQSLQAAMGDNSDYSDLSQVCVNTKIDCASSQSFSCDLDIAKLGFTPGRSAQKSMMIRGTAEKSNSDKAKVTVIYQPTNVGLRTSLFSGEITSSGNNYKMKLRASPREMTAQGSSFGISPPDTD